MFWINEGYEGYFEETFGPGGIWREFLSRSAGYVTSELGCESLAERRFRLRDIWKSHLEFEVFREMFAADYEQLNQSIELDKIVEREELIGSTTRTRTSTAKKV